MKNILTFDIEDWYHPNLTEKTLLSKMEIEDRVVEPTLRIIKMLDDTENSATFFVLGDVAEKFPELIQKIESQGHELGSHGYKHNLVYNYTEHQFETDIRKSLEILGETASQKILGYRAPSWSLSDKTPWAWEVLYSLGFTYDSSVYPFKTFLYGDSSAQRFAYDINLQNGVKFTEIPPSVAEVFSKRFPFSGGFFFRIAPFWYIKRCIRQYNKLGKPAVIYLHPWEIDVDQPRLPVDAKKRFILYANLKKTEEKLFRMLEEFKFQSIRDHFGFSNKPTSRDRVLKKETV